MLISLAYDWQHYMLCPAMPEVAWSPHCLRTSAEPAPSSQWLGVRVVREPVIRIILHPKPPSLPTLLLNLGQKEKSFLRKPSGPKKQPKHKVFGRDIPGTSGTQTSGHPGQKLYASGLVCCFRQGVAGMSRIWAGTSRIWKNFMQETLG